MSNIILNTETPTPQNHSSGVVTSELNAQLFPPRFHQEIDQLIEKYVSQSKNTSAKALPETPKLQIDPEYHSEGLHVQECCLQLGPHFLIFDSFDACLDNKTSITELIEFTRDSLNKIKGKHAHNITLGVIRNISLSSLLQVKGAELIDLDKGISASSHTAVILKSGLLVNIANTLIEIVAQQGDNHHQYKLYSEIDNGLVWAFAELHKELDLKSP